MQYGMRKKITKELSDGNLGSAWLKSDQINEGNVQRTSGIRDVNSNLVGRYYLISG